jgi:hypothetical protein
MRVGRSPVVERNSLVFKVEVPEHLKYRPPKVSNPYVVGVQSRYRSPPKKLVNLDNIGENKRGASPPKNPQYVHVESRFRSPKQQNLVQLLTDECRLSKMESIRMTEEYMVHKEACGSLRHVPSRYFDMYLKAKSDSPTRREEVYDERRRQHHEVTKSGKPFCVPLHPISGTFSSMASSEAKPLERKKDPTSPSARAKSVVMDWVNYGIPIPCRETDPPKHPVPVPRMGGRPFASAGGAGGGCFERRLSSPKRPAGQIEDKKIQGLLERMNSLRTSSPPAAASKPLRRTPSPNSAEQPFSPTTTQRGSSAATRRTVSPPARGTCLKQPWLPGNPTSMRATSPKRAVPKPTRRATPGVISPVRQATTPPPQQKHQDPLNDTDVLCSAISDLTEESHCTPRITTSRPRVFLSPPHLISPR